MHNAFSTINCNSGAGVCYWSDTPALLRSICDTTDEIAISCGAQFLQMLESLRSTREESTKKCSHCCRDESKGRLRD